MGEQLKNGGLTRSWLPVLAVVVVSGAAGYAFARWILVPMIVAG